MLLTYFELNLGYGKWLTDSRPIRDCQLKVVDLIKWVIGLFGDTMISKK